MEEFTSAFECRVLTFTFCQKEHVIQRRLEAMALPEAIPSFS